MHLASIWGHIKLANSLRETMHHFGPQISLRPVSAAIGGEFSPRESLASVSPRGMTPRGLFSAQSPRLMNLKNMHHNPTSLFA